MRCEEFKKNWQDFSDERLSAEKNDVAAAHLGECAGCREFDERMRKLEFSLEELVSDAPAPSEFLVTRIMANVEELSMRPSLLGRFKGLFSLPRLAAVAAVAVAFFAGTLTNQIAEPGEVADEFAAKRKVVIEYDGVNSDRVGLVGDFNEWGRKDVPIDASLVDGKWHFEIQLTPGRYQYTFIVDGKKWLPDPNATGIIPDGFGGLNSLLYVNDHEGI